MNSPHVLFVTEKYADGNPAWLSNSHHNLFGSLECSGLARHSNFFFEDHQGRCDADLIRQHRACDPDLTVITILPNPDFQNNPTAKSFAEISKRSPVVFVWFDSIYTSILGMAEQAAPYAALTVILDNPFFTPREKFLNLWTPQDTRIYNDPRRDRDIDVSFLGSVSGYQDRPSLIGHLMARCEANVHRDGGQRESNLSPQDYAAAMQRSKISLNFSKTRSGLQQTKGRLWEITLCGAMLMEDANQGTQRWFEPFKDYVPFVSADDMTDKVKYYLDHPQEMGEIAANGKLKSEIMYSPKNWWKSVFDRCGIQTPIN